MATVQHSLYQAAALPLWQGKLCLVTASRSRRWVIPKGRAERGKTLGQIALQEAWEEAGLRGELHSEPTGSYFYYKSGDLFHVTVFLMQVTSMAHKWPEQFKRERLWLSPEDALTRLEEPALLEVVRSIVPPAGIPGPHIPMFHSPQLALTS